MNKLTFKEWDRSESGFEVLAWYPERSVALLLDKDNRPMVLDLGLPRLDQKGWTYVGDPLPNTPPVEVRSTWLMLPPCRVDEPAVNRLRVPQPDRGPIPLFPPEHKPWELEWVRRGGGILVPTPEDRKPLRQWLEQFKAQKREEYVRRKQELADGILPSTPAWRRLMPVPLSFRRAEAWQFNQESIRLELEFTAPYREESMLGLGPTAGYFNWTLEIAMRHSEFITPYLEEKWLRENGLDRAVMEEERKQFIKFVEAHAVNGFEIKPRPLSREEALRRFMVSGTSASSACENQWQVPALQITPIEELVLCAQVRHVMTFGGNTRVWLAKYELREPRGPEEQRAFDACLGKGSEAERIETAVGMVVSERNALKAVADQIGAERATLADTMAPLTKLYSEVELAEVRRRAVGQGVPDLFADWVLVNFKASDPPRLPTKGDAFDHCGPHTLLGRRLEAAGCGVSKQRLAAHLTVLRRLLEGKGWLARRVPGKSRRRASGYLPDERYEDMNQPTPAEVAADRDFESGDPAAEDRDQPDPRADD